MFSYNLDANASASQYPLLMLTTLDVNKNSLLILLVDFFK